jgi:NADH dehydrogenase
VFGIPYALGWLQAAMMELAPGQPLMSRDNLRSIKVDNVATPQQPGLQALHIQPASLAGVAPGYSGARGPRSALNRLREAAGR